MILDNEQQRQILLMALTEAGFPGSNKIAVAMVQQAVQTATVAPQPAGAPTTESVTSVTD